jgi:hypothetical protein
VSGDGRKRHFRAAWLAQVGAENDEMNLRRDGGSLKNLSERVPEIFQATMPAPRRPIDCSEGSCGITALLAGSRPQFTPAQAGAGMTP